MGKIHVRMAVNERRDGGIAGSERAYGAWSALAVALHVDPAMLAAESLSGGSTSV